MNNADRDSPPSKLARVAKINFDDSTLLEENLRRTQARYAHALVIFSNGSGRITQGNVHTLNPYIKGVRILGDNFVLIFDSEASRAQAYKELAAQTDLRVEYYKSNINQRSNDSKVNKLILMAQGMPETVNERRMQELFPNALKTFLSRPSGKTPYAVINFFDENDAYDTFKRCEGFVVDGFSVDVHYAFMPKDEQLNKKEVYVYGIPGDVNLQRMKNVFGRVTEMVVKPNRKTAESAPFYVLAKYENEADAAMLLERAAELGSGYTRVVAQYAKIKTSHDNPIYVDHNFLYHYSSSISLSLAVPSQWIKESRDRRAKEEGRLTETQRKGLQKHRKRLREKLTLPNVNIDAETTSQNKPLQLDESDVDEPDNYGAENVPPICTINNLRKKMNDLMANWQGGSSREFIEFFIAGVSDIVKDGSLNESNNNLTEPEIRPTINDYWSRVRATLETAAPGLTWTSRRTRELVKSHFAECSSQAHTDDAPARSHSPVRMYFHPLISQSPHQILSNDDLTRSVATSPVSFFNKPAISRSSCQISKRKPLLDCASTSYVEKGVLFAKSPITNNDDDVNNNASSTRVPLLSLPFNNARNSKEAEKPQSFLSRKIDAVISTKRSLLATPSPNASENVGEAIGPKKRALLESLAVLSKKYDNVSPLKTPAACMSNC